MASMQPIPERIAKHRVVRDWLRYMLKVTEQTIQDLEAQEAEERRRREVARRESSWKIQPSRAEKGHPVLHRGACSLYTESFGFVNRDEVAIAFREFPDMEMCAVCNPWGSLGVPKPVPGRRVVVADPDEPA